MAKIDAQAVLDEGAELREKFLEAQALKQVADKAYREVNVAYSEWQSKYGALSTALQEMEADDGS